MKRKLYTLNMLSRSVNVSIALMLGTFLVASTIGLPHFGMDMATESDGQMMENNCFMPGMAEALCQMNPLEHIAAWQSMFTAVPSQNNLLLLLTTLFALALGALFFTRYSTAPPKVLIPHISFTYYKQDAPIFNPLQEAFSNGILHPKIF